MAERGSKKNNGEKSQGDEGRRPSGRFRSRVFGLLKLFLGILVVPLCVGTSAAFIYNFRLLEPAVIKCFINGAVTFIALFFLIWEPLLLYNKGQRIISVIFSFFLPLVKVASYVLPAYVIVLFAGYFILRFFGLEGPALGCIVFLIGFSQALHLAFTARTLRQKKDFLKANYVFGFSAIYVLNIFILALGISFMFARFSFLDFARSACQITGEIYRPLVAQLFMV
ncbi:MAG: hypothetical protein PHR44_02875 [Candidatus Omnitrophica bacterium]|nr:hypothetical protein [Candidatus Omnitrophota bacterium]